MLTVHLPEDIEKHLRAAVEGGEYPSIDAAIDLALRRLLKPPPPQGPLTQEELDRYMLEVGMISQLPNINEPDEDEPELIEIEGEPLSETIIRERR